MQFPHRPDEGSPGRQARGQSESALELLKMIFYLNASLGPKALQHACIEVWTCWISTQTEKIRVGQEVFSTSRTPPAPSAPTWCFPCVMMWMLGTDPRRQRGERWWGLRTLDVAAIGSAVKFFTGGVLRAYKRYRLNVRERLWEHAVWSSLASSRYIPALCQDVSITRVSPLPTFDALTLPHKEARAAIVGRLTRIACRIVCDTAPILWSMRDVRFHPSVFARSKVTRDIPTGTERD